jgi:toxin ParE1/3/4
LTASYVLTASAEADLRGIIRYTRNQWGDRQVRRYVAQLSNGIERLVNAEGSFRDLPDVYPGLRVLRCEHHYVFCLLRPDAPTLVIALFHEKMDLMERLADRLNERS